MVRTLPLSLFAAAALHAQISADLELLTKIRFHELDQLRGQPNYTCVETVERSQRAASTRKYTLLDTLRLEVALVGPKELFAWPGAKKFEDMELSEQNLTNRSPMRQPLRSVAGGKPHPLGGAVVFMNDRA